MKPILLIAWREYRQYVFSRGFLLLLVMLPVLAIAGGAILSVVENARPQRAFVVVDQTSEYVALIDQELEQQRLRDTIEAWDLYLEVALDREKIDPGNVEAPFGVAPITHSRLDKFKVQGGVERGNAVVSDFRKKGFPEFSSPRQRFVRLELPEEIIQTQTLKEAADQLQPYLLGEKQLEGASTDGLFAAILIPENFGQETDGGDVESRDADAEYWSKNLTDPSLQFAVSRALRSVLRRQEAARLGITGEQLEGLADIEAPIGVYRPGRETNDDAIAAADRLEKVVLPGVMTYVLLVVVLAVGNPLLTNTIEERSNKIVEVLLSSVTSDQLMAGKLLGIAAVGLTMPAIFLIGASAASLIGLSGSEATQTALGALFRSNLLPIYLFYFLCAYLIFAMIFLAIGALSNSIQDAQTFMGPLMLVVFAPMPFVIMVFQNPNGLVASILTWIPIYTPYAVLLRVSADPPFWEILGATALMLVFALLLARVMGRIFKNAILNASPPKVSEIWRLAREEPS